MTWWSRLAFVVLWTVQAVFAFLAGLAMSVILFGPQEHFGVAVIRAIPLGFGWLLAVNWIAKRLRRFGRGGGIR